MAEESRFFNHIDGDRQYNADEFAEYFRQVLTNGILNGGTNLQVYVTGADRVARIKSGKAWLEGYFYKLTDELELPLAEAHGTYDRIDRIVVRLDRRPEARHVRAFVLTGEPAMEPVPPALTREGLVYEIGLAKVLVVHNTSVLQPGNVTDERLDASVCGLVNSLVQVDAAHMTQQWEEWYSANTSRWEQDWAGWYSTNTTNWQQEWEEWFASVQSQNYIPASEKGQAGGVAKQDDFVVHSTGVHPRLAGAAQFNGTEGVIINHNKGDLNYYVLVLPSQDTQGYLGEVWVEKGEETLTIFNSGSSTATFDYTILW